jgi:hypothetical protein
MSDPVQIAWITTTGVVLCGGFSILVVMLTRMEKKVNGRLTEFIEAVKKIAKEEGRAEEKAREHKDQDGKPGG